jgi:hypothetical protein
MVIRSESEGGNNPVNELSETSTETLEVNNFDFQRLGPSERSETST